MPDAAPVMGYERVTLYGLALVAHRRIGYAQVDPELARDLFIRHALVEGDWQNRHHFFRDNTTHCVPNLPTWRSALAAATFLSTMTRSTRCTTPACRRRWCRRGTSTVGGRDNGTARRTLLTFSRDDLLRNDDDADQPNTWEAADLSLPLTYRFEPGVADDGVTVHIPVQVLARLGGDEFAWHVPALREELITALIRSLPKELRRNFVPAPDTARAAVASLDPGTGSLLEALQRELRRRSGVLVPIDAFDLEKLPDHLRVTFAVESDDGTELARGKDLEALQERLAAPVRNAVAEAFAGKLERKGLRAWPDDLDELPRVVETTGGGRAVRGYPALVDKGATVDVRVFATPLEQAAAMGPGTRRLLRLTVPSPAKALEKQLDTRTRLRLGSQSRRLARRPCWTTAPMPRWPHLRRIQPGVERTSPPWRARVAAAMATTMRDIISRVERVLAALHEVQLALPGTPPPAQAEAIADIRAQLAALLPTGFVTAAGGAHLLDLARYLTAIGRRLDRLPQGLTADRERMLRVHALQDAYEVVVEALSSSRAANDDVRDVARFIEEFRVSLWAQQLGTARPVSEQRIYRAIDALTQS